MDVLFVSSEIFPFAKTGGLADVSYSLTEALKEHISISRVMPLYRFMEQTAFESYDNFTVTLDGMHYPVEILVQKEQGLHTYVVKAAHLSQTDSLYGDRNGDYPDNALRFGIFCMAIVELAIRLNVKLIHLNDWHTALVALFVKEYRLNIKTVFTIHNLAYQGIFDAAALETLGISRRYFTMDALEFYGKVNFLKAGIAYSDALTTVSRTYAKEILTVQFGCGLDGFLQRHKGKLTGILNGIDHELYPPLKKRSEKTKAKTALCKKFGFENASLPLFVMISRLVEQKGIDLLIKSFDRLQSKQINIFILGEGEEAYCKALDKLARKYKNFSFYRGYDEALSHQTYLASDFLLMPSVFEPCGLNQLIAMHYGSIPVVHEVGGLKDSVHEGMDLCGKGICYAGQNTKEFVYAVERALILKQNRKKADAVIAFNLQCDFSFDKSAKEYLKLYESLLCS